MDKNKIASLIVVGVLVVVLIIACCVKGDNKFSSNTNTELSDDTETVMNNLQTESDSIKESEMGDFKEEIGVSQYFDLMDESDNSLVLVARPTCSYCQLVEPVIRKLIKDNDLSIYYLNTDNFSDGDTTEFVNSNEEWKEGFGTPMLLVVGGGDLIDFLDGATDTAHYIDFMKYYKFIKE